MIFEVQHQEKSAKRVGNVRPVNEKKTVVNA